MMQSMPIALEKPHTVLPSRFAYLMGLYAENYHRLARLFAPQNLAVGRYVSSVDDGLDVQLEVIERHAYTLELKLTYRMRDLQSGEATPSAWLRMYRDAHVAEVSHYHAGKHLWHALGPFPETKTLFAHRMRMASFFNRWLEYLAEQGHSRGTLVAESDLDASDAQQ
jgi:uncharacterized protein YqiB (DUF1249 family)